MQSRDETQDKGQSLFNRLQRKVDFASRVDEIAENLRDQHHFTISTFQAYSIAINESTDIRNIAQLAIFIRGCDVNLKINEELLEVISMHNTTTGADIFDALMEVLKQYKLPLDKLGLNHRQFTAFLEDIESEFTDLPYHTGVRGLSSQSIKTIFQTLDEIIIFLETKNIRMGRIKDGQWPSQLISQE
ncbi:general transcription factor II-I repeat domain-containing protein 2 [Trichonephila clavipes]|nr:general transcription factor II-I repeat domain-containing protein 2 [Trichonephila clavipes]